MFSSLSEDAQGPPRILPVPFLTRKGLVILAGIRIGPWRACCFESVVWLLLLVLVCMRGF